MTKNKVRGTSTHSVRNAKTGAWEERQQWVKKETVTNIEDIAGVIKTTLQETLKYQPELPSQQTAAWKPSDTFTVYPVGDHHLGMLSWPEETGGDYNVKIGTKLLEKATAYLLGKADERSDCLLVFLGDFMHFDSLEAVTPQNKNMLDSDSRYPIMARAAIRLMQTMIDMCAVRHNKVHCIVEQGNHDPTSAIMLREALHAHYVKVKRVNVDNAPGVFHYLRWQNNLIGTHHGHTVRQLATLPMIMAQDRKKEWAATDHRVFLTGHRHKDIVLDLVGCRVESVRILPPADAWAHESGYRPYRQMTSIQLHKKHGEIARHFVKPSMLGF